MPTKIKKTNTTRGRPRKEFKIKPKKSSTVKRGRGRPRKDTSIKPTDNINTRISKHGNDIKKISKNQKKIHLEINNSSFFSKKLKKEENTKSDKFALWLLIFSMLLFIFSLYKTFYLTSNNINNTDVNIDRWIIVDTGTTIIHDVSNIKWVTSDAIAKNTSSPTVHTSTVDLNDGLMIKVFYDEINKQNYGEIYNFADSYMKSSSLFRLYYAENWLWNFLSHLTNERVYITNIQEITWENNKEWVTYYTYDIKYKLKNNNELFIEQWKAAIVTRNNQKLIGSLQCTNIWCSKMPFFNPERHSIK